MYNLCELLSTNFTRGDKYDKMQKNSREAEKSMHPFIHLGNITLPMYGLCTMVGTVFALLAVFRLRKKGSPISEDNLLDALIWAIVLGFLCSKILYFIVDPPQMPHSWSEVWDLISTGLVFYGGLIGGLLGCYCQRYLISNNSEHHHCSAPTLPTWKKWPCREERAPVPQQSALKLTSAIG